MSIDTEIQLNTSITTTASGVIDVTPSVVETCNIPSNITVEGHKKEYAIVGDSLYASVSADEAPAWLTGIIDSTVSTIVAAGMLNYDTLVQDVRSAIDSIDVAKNTFTTSVEVNNIADGIVASTVSTLNATYEATFATKVEVDTAVATSEASLAQSISNLSSSFSNDLDANITSVQTAFASADAILASDITALEAAYIDQESSISGFASAVSGLQTYVGLDPNGVPNGTGIIDSVQSLSQFYVNLENEVTGPTGHVSQSLASLEVVSATYADSVGTSVENKFAYNSTIELDGTYYRSGFGLTATAAGGSGTALDPYNSEFWVNAEKFKFTNSNQTGQVAPFTIDASGATPQITFNGGVSFSNVSGTSDVALTSELPQSVTTVIDGGVITTGGLTLVSGGASLGGAIRSGKVTYLDGQPGLWIGSDNVSPKVNIGDTNNYLNWDGYNLDIKGTVTFSSGSSSDDLTALAFKNSVDWGSEVSGVGKPSNFADPTKTVIDGGLITSGGLTLSAGGVVKSGKSTYLDTQTGFWLGNDGGTSKLHIGNGTNRLQWDGANLTVIGGNIYANKFHGVQTRISDYGNNTYGPLVNTIGTQGYMSTPTVGVEGYYTQLYNVITPKSSISGVYNKVTSVGAFMASAGTVFNLRTGNTTTIPYNVTMYLEYTIDNGVWYTVHSDTIAVAANMPVNYPLNFNLSRTIPLFTEAGALTSIAVGDVIQFRTKLVSSVQMTFSGNYYSTHIVNNI